MDNPRMNMDRTEGRSRLAFIIVHIALIALLLLPSSFIIVEADHDCDGADCPICQCIQAVENFMDSLGSGAGTTLLLTDLTLAAAILLVGTGRTSYTYSLIQQKVRLNI